MIWEADPAEGLVLVSKLNVTDMYHHGTLRTSQVDAFKYVSPSDPDNDGIVIFVDLFLLMGWVDPT